MLPSILIRWGQLMTLVLSVLLLGTACTTAIARQIQAAPATFTIELAETGLTVPERLPSGIVSITFNNTGQVGQHLSLVRLKPGVAAEKFQATLAENPGETIALVHLLSESLLAPNAGGQIVYDLKEGTHLALSFPDTEEDTPPLTAVFQVSGKAGVGVAPQAEVKVEMNDFAFVMPAQIKAGRQTWQIANTGQQWHELAIVKLTQDATVADVIAAMSQEEEAQGPPPFEMIATWGPVSEGERAWTTIDLPPGEYTVICGLPDLAGEGHSHLDLGMVHSLTVAK